MSAWDVAFIDEEEEGYLEFDEKGRGEFHFGYVHGQMDCKPTTRDSEPAAEWTWDGNEDAPTLTPSVHHVGAWHGWIRAGRMESC